MKKTIRFKAPCAVVFALLAAFGSISSAQQAIEISTEKFGPRALPFALPPTVVASASMLVAAPSDSGPVDGSLAAKPRLSSEKDKAGSVAAVPGAAPAVNAQPVGWAVSTSDGVLRKVIAKWAKQADWKFADYHWAVDRDLPVMADDVFNGDFRSAVRALLTSSELTDTPLQPCFYSNQVVRVISRAELCDRAAAGQ